jgi:hypothetical protein
VRRCRQPAVLPHLHCPLLPPPRLAGQLDALEAGAEAEGFLDRVLGTNCFSQAVGELASDCRRLEQEGKSRLALRLMNCQLAVQQGATFPCPRRQSIKECTEVLPDRAYALFVEFLTHADRCAWGGVQWCVCAGALLVGQAGTVAARSASACFPCVHPQACNCDPQSAFPTRPLCCSMCLYIQNQNFEKYTENMLNRLAEGAGLAKEQLAAVAKSTGALGRDTAALQRKAEAALGLLRQHSELEEVRAPTGGGVGCGVHACMPAARAHTTVTAWRGLPACLARAAGVTEAAEESAGGDAVLLHEPGCQAAGGAGGAGACTRNCAVAAKPLAAVLAADSINLRAADRPRTIRGNK